MRTVYLALALGAGAALATQSVLSSLPSQPETEHAAPVFGTADDLRASLEAAAARQLRDAPKELQQDTANLRNVLLIIIDDLRTEVGTYGSPHAITPNIDSFAQQGATFDHFYVPFAACTPSRFALMTGKRTTAQDIALGSDLTVNKQFAEGTTLPDLFLSNGYETYTFGKVYHWRYDDRDAWTKIVPTTEHDFMAQFRDAEGNFVSPTNRWSGERLPDEVSVRLAAKEMQSLAASDAKFFMAVGIHRPHLSWYAPERDWNLYTPERLPAPVNPDGQSGAPPFALYHVSEFRWQAALRDYGEDVPDDVAQDLRWGYMASVSYADRMVGKLLWGLKNAGLDRNTIVVLVSDHGFRLGDHGGWGKVTNSSIDIRVPLMIKVPGIVRPGLRVTRVAEMVDLFPTLADLMDMEAPATVEGRSLVPVLTGYPSVWKPAAFSLTVREIETNGNTETLIGENVSSRRYRYTAWLDANGRIVAREMYDKVADPAESTNRATDPAYQAVMGWMEKQRNLGWQNMP